MGDQFLSNMPFPNRNSGSLTNNSEPNVNREGISSIEGIANNRQTLNETIKNSKKSNEKNDTSWLGDLPTSKHDNYKLAQSQQFSNKINEDIILKKSEPISPIDMSNTMSRTSVPLPVNALTSSMTLNRSISKNENTTRPKTATPGKHTQYYNILYDKEYRRFFEHDTFCQNLKYVLASKFSIQVKITNSRDECVEEYIAYVVILSGSTAQVELACDKLELLLTSALKKISFNNSIDYVWTSNSDVVQMFQTYVDEHNINCIFELSKSMELTAYYFTRTIASLEELCTNEETINEIVNKKFKSINIKIPDEMDPKTIDEYFREFQNACLDQIGEPSFLLTRQNDQFVLVGLPHLVNGAKAKCEKLIQKYMIGEVKLNLQDYQIEFLLTVYQNELKQLEEENKGLQILNHIKSGYFVGPKKSHNKVTDKLNHMAATCHRSESILKDVKLGSSVTTEMEKLQEKAKTYQCLVQTQLERTDKIYSPPASFLDSSANAVAPAAMSIDIRIGDLAEQSVDMVVVCYTSGYLLQNILEKAGSKTRKHFEEAFENGLITHDGYEMGSGKLLCQKLFMLPWIMNRVDDETLRDTIRIFFTAAVQHAVNTGKTSLAFPALGCGELAYDPKMIAEVILDEIQRYASYNLKIFIVLLPEKLGAYAAFCLRLAELRRRTPTTIQTRFCYQHTNIKLTLIGFKEKIDQYLKVVHNHMNECVQTRECDEFPLDVWDQQTINVFYKYCFDRNVLPEINSKNEHLKLLGPTETVKAAETEYYRMKSMKAEEARIASYARIAVWLYKVDDTNVQKYSLKLNAVIEHAHSNSLASVKFKNQNSEECTIIFKDMIEVYGERQRKVIRKDFESPSNWEHQTEDVIRYELDSNTDEYKDVLDRFNAKMAGKYIEIRVERIQNQRWYMAYKTFKHYSKQKDTEELMFHGCPETSADMIIHSCFNRSFAGVNGVLYGVGVYFSRNASYSHGYTRESPITHQRCMFLVKVLVGKTGEGNSKTKAPPEGCHSTTDGKDIIVTYHDDQAYAAYLITYKSPPSSM